MTIEQKAREIAGGLSSAAKRTLKRNWPVNSWSLLRSHIRHFNRNGMIEAASLTDYRLTPLGEQVRALIEEQKP